MLEFQELERNAFKATLVLGVVKGTVFTLIAILIVSDASFIRVVGAFTIGISLGLLLEYLGSFRPNMREHKWLMERGGDSYIHDLRSALNKLGLMKMLQHQWFVKRYHQVRGI
jgi:hypothetical protein